VAGLTCQTTVTQSLKKQLKVGQMLFMGAAGDELVVQVYKNKRQMTKQLDQKPIS
jgi:hypothetical protein